MVKLAYEVRGDQVKVLIAVKVGVRVESNHGIKHRGKSI